MSHRNSDARGKALESGEKLKGQGNSNAYQILPDFCSPREGRGQRPLDPAVTHDPAITSAEAIPAPTTDEAAVAVCYDNARLARYLGVSVRSLDRANAAGLLPCPDLVCGRSPRWSPSTIAKWLKTRPKLPGRGGHHG
jgi:hypothetical protein